MTEPAPDYVTVIKQPRPDSQELYTVRLMSWDSRADSYQVKSTCGPYAYAMALHRAGEWAASLKVEVR